MERILFFSIMNGDAWGGSEEIWYQSALWLVKNGYRIDVCCFDWPEKQTRLDTLRLAGCGLYLLPGKKQTKGLFENSKLKKSLAAVNFNMYTNIILNQGGWKDVAYTPFKSLYKQLANYQLIFHNYNINEKLNASRHASLQAWVNNATHNFADAGRVFEELEKAYSISFPHQHVLFNPLTFETPNLPADYPKLNNEKYIFSVLAALDVERKAQDVLIKTLSSSKWKERNWELHLYGEGKDLSILKSLIKDLRLQDKIFLKGYTTNVKNVIEQSHIILQITHIDAMPISVIEAMSLARPVIVSTTGDMPLWVKEGENGWIVDEISVNGIDKVLEKAWNERNKWNVKGQNSFRIFQQQFPNDPIIHFLQQAGIISLTQS